MRAKHLGLGVMALGLAIFFGLAWLLHAQDGVLWEFDRTLAKAAKGHAQGTGPAPGSRNVSIQRLGPRHTPNRDNSGPTLVRVDRFGTRGTRSVHE